MTMGKAILPAIGAMGLGAGLMYMMDPEEGPRRRAMMRDKMAHWGNEAEDMVEGKARHMSNKAKGMMAEAKSHMHEMGMSDEPM
jgi:hypothetical protein